MIASGTHEHAATQSQPTSVEEVRAELYRMLDELGTSRADTATIKTRFTELWNQLGGGEEPTLH